MDGIYYTNVISIQYGGRYLLHKCYKYSIRWTVFITQMLEVFNTVDGIYYTNVRSIQYGGRYLLHKCYKYSIRWTVLANKTS